MVSPAEFIPIAEASSLIVDIGYWVLNSACQQLEKWSKIEAARNLKLAINVSARQFSMPNFIDTIKKAIRTHGIEPSHLKLELTESVILIDVDEVVIKMQALKALGVRLSLDDFGTGYSSLSYLKKLPFDQLKIDQSFVQDILRDPNDAMMVKTIIEMGRNFRLNVIAEGVETEAQYEFLKLNGCMAYQGYLFSKPLPIEQFEKLLKQA
jgi:EAL domain-containing protein (putative c-di-GMP-specific phosphodiesterase class I)